MNESSPPPAGSGGMSLLLAALVGLFFLFVLVLLTGGYFFYVVAWVLVIGVIGALHYVLWGRAFEQATASERKEIELLEKARSDDAEE